MNSRSYIVPTFLAVALHAVVLTLLFNSWFGHASEEQKITPRHVKATIVDLSAQQQATTREQEKKRQAEEARKQKEQERKKAEEEQRKKEAEQKKAEEAKQQEAERKKAEEEQRKKEAEQKKVEEAKRQEAEKKKAEEAERKKVEEAKRKEAERKKVEEAKRKEAERKKAEEAKRKKEAERKKAEEARKKKEAERKKAEEAKRKEAERKKAEEAKRKEAERKKAEEARRKAEQAARDKAIADALAEEERYIQEQQDQATVASYEGYISNEITRNWRRSPTARNGMEVTLSLHLLPTGEVDNVVVADSSGDSRFDQDAVRAVKRVERFDKLQQLDPALFDRYFRKLNLKFRPEDLRR